jgi:hypothetical protein
MTSIAIYRILFSFIPRSLVLLMPHFFFLLLTSTECCFLYIGTKIYFFIDLNNSKKKIDRGGRYH